MRKKHRRVYWRVRREEEEDFVHSLLFGWFIGKFFVGSNSFLPFFPCFTLWRGDDRWLKTEPTTADQRCRRRRIPASQGHLSSVSAINCCYTWLRYLISLSSFFFFSFLILEQKLIKVQYVESEQIGSHSKYFLEQPFWLNFWKIFLILVKFLFTFFIFTVTLTLLIKKKFIYYRNNIWKKIPTIYYLKFFLQI